MLRSIIWITLVAALIGWTAAPAAAQSSIGLGSSSSGSSLGSIGTLGTSGSGTSGTSRSGLSNTSSGGFTGSTSYGGGTTSSYGSGSSSGSGSLGTTLGTTSYGTTTYLGKYYGNPLAIGVPTSSSVGSQYLRSYPTQLTFGTPLYGMPNLSTSNRSGTTTYGSVLTTQASPYSGASSSGTRRAPAYITVPVFDQAPRPSATVMQANLQKIIAKSSRLPSRNGINVSMDGSVAVLRGQVRDERERRLAEFLLQLSPGVRAIRNELIPSANAPAASQ